MTKDQEEIEHLANLAFEGKLDDLNSERLNQLLAKKESLRAFYAQLAMIEILVNYECRTDNLPLVFE